MHITRHGGGCCGIDHIVGFEFGYNAESKKRFAAEFVRQVAAWKRRNPSRLLEATLTDGQMRTWASHLQEIGFKLVDRFNNSNSENTVNLLTFKSAAKTSQTQL